MSDLEFDSAEVCITPSFSLSFMVMLFLDLTYDLKHVCFVFLIIKHICFMF